MPGIDGVSDRFGNFWEPSQNTVFWKPILSILLGIRNMRIVVVGMLCLRVRASNVELQEASPHGSLQYFRGTSAIYRMALDAEAEAQRWRSNRTILPRRPYAKGCFQQPESACRRLAMDPVFVDAAKALVGEKDLFVMATNPVRKVPGDRQDLHVDLDVWAPECGGNNSVSVWLLLEHDPAARTPIVFVDGSEKTEALAQELRNSMGCRTAGGWYNLENKADDELRCQADAMTRVASERWPELGLEVARGPADAGVGVAWRGWTWHMTHDDGDRFAFLVQYGTEKCVRAVRRPRHWDIVRDTPHWRSDDWFAFVPVDPESVKIPSPFDQLIGVPPQKSTNGKHRKTTPASKARHHSQPHRKSNDLCRPTVDKSVDKLSRRAEPFQLAPRRPPWSPTSADENGWTDAVASPHLSLLTARVSRTSSGAVFQPPHVHRYLDEIRIVLEGSVTYGVGYTGECGYYAVYDALPGHVNFFPSRLSRTSLASNSTELVLYFAPKLGRPRTDASHSENFPSFGDPARRFLTQASMAGDRLRATHAAESSLCSNGTRPLPGTTVSSTVWSLIPVRPDQVKRAFLEERRHALKDIGYRHLRSKVVSYGAFFAATPSSHFYDTVVVPLTGAIRITTHGGRVLSLVTLGSFALVPAGLAHGFQADRDSSVDVLTIELAGDIEVYPNRGGGLKRGLDVTNITAAVGHHLNATTASLLDNASPLA